MSSHEDSVPETITRQEYLRTMFQPDCDFVDGRIEKRNVGEEGHGKVQKMLLKLFERFESAGSMQW